MNFKNIFADNDAVSPVIGVILMVAITVILAAVIGTFVLGLGDQVSNTSPTASFTFDYDEGNAGDACQGGSNNDLGGSTEGALTITHDGGDQINEDLLSVTDGSNSISDLEQCGGISSDQDVGAGDSFAPDVESSDTIRVIWSSQNGGDTSTLGKWTGPTA